MEAKVFLTGNLGNDAQVTNFSNGNAVIEFSTQGKPLCNSRNQPSAKNRITVFLRRGSVHQFPGF
jgi:single-stranded DNA-binding protein